MTSDNRLGITSSTEANPNDMRRIEPALSAWEVWITACRGAEPGVRPVMSDRGRPLVTLSNGTRQDDPVKLNEKVAAGIAEEYLDRWRRVARYDELAVMEENGDKDWKNVTGEDGREYKAQSIERQPQRLTTAVSKKALKDSESLLPRLL